MKSWIGIASLLTLTTSCHGSEPPPRGVDGLSREEAWDGRNAPQVFGQQSMRYQDLAQDQFLWGSLDEQPWSDDYWPFKRAGLAKRWLLPGQAIDIDVNAPDYGEETRRKIAAFLGFAQAADEITRYRLSPVEKYDLVTSRGFPVTRRELVNYADKLKYFEENRIPWDWMGYCDGWALAALQVPAPRHAVLVAATRGDPVLFTVGDIRGLVSKAYTENFKSRNEQFLGTRCDRRVDEIAGDENRRIADGTLGRWRNGALAAGRNIQIVYNNWRLAGHQELSTDENVLVFRYDDAPDELYWLRAVSWTDAMEEIARVEVRPMPNGELDPSVPMEELDFRYLKSCRDLNAGAFHIVLARLLSEAAANQNGRALGFALEVSRAHEVWTHPVYAYETRLGEPLDLEALDPDGPQDPYAAYRAPGTRYLVHTYTTVYYGLEHGPLVIYDQDDEWGAYRTYQYLLELDERGYVIGGEWQWAVRQTADQLSPLSGTELLEFLGGGNAYDGVDFPDFIWRFPEDTRLLETCNDPPCLSAQAVYRLAACSLETPQAGDTVVLGGRTIPFVRCDL